MEKVYSGELAVIPLVIILALVIILVLVIIALVALELSDYYYRQDRKKEQMRREVESEKTDNC